MKTNMHRSTSRRALSAECAATEPLEQSHSNKTPQKTVLIAVVLMMAGMAGAANVPPGITGLWRFQSALSNASATMEATIGLDMINSAPPGNGHWLIGPWTDIGIDSWHTKFSGNGVSQERSWDYLTVHPNFAANGGSSLGYVNEYTIAIDYVQTAQLSAMWNSLFQTAADAHGNDGDLWIAGTNATAKTIYTSELGHSSLTFDPSKWHRIVWSVDNGNFFRVYVDGTLFLDGAGQAIDGRYSLDPNRFHLFADNSWEDAWGLVGTVATWNRALTSVEVADLGGWIGTNAAPTPLLFPDGPPELMSVSPSNGEINVAPAFNYLAIILDLDGFVDTNSIELLLDGAPVIPRVKRAGSISIDFSEGGLLRSGSTHTYTLAMSASGVSSTNEVTFTVQDYTSYEWGFTEGDLTSGLGNGTMSYVDGPAGTTFGTTDGGTVPHINGSPATYMHVPAFTSDTDGYWLYFDDSGPNVGTNAYINRYTLLMDLMVPEPWATNGWLVPFFNKDPYNFDGDADFYLRWDGAIGIGYTGYSDAGTMTSNTWCRIAFVADLEANTIDYYANGINVKSGNADGLGGRWSLYSNQDPGPDLLLFNESDTGGIWTHELYLSSVAFTDRALSADELAALGGPEAEGILVESFTPAPTLTSRQWGEDVVISWPSNYVGYALQRKANLGNGTWVPASGVTNNSVSIPITSGRQFFRLVQ